MFLNAVMLAGIGGAVLPLVLHLLSRARYRSVDWGAMMFLQGADSRQRQSTQLKQWILLMVRMAVVGLLAVALARPIVRGSWARVTEQGNVTALIVIDASASMSFREGDRTRFDLARQAALQVVKNLRPGDQASVLLAGIDQAEADLRPTADLAAVSDRILNAKPGSVGADLAEALARAAQVLDRFAELNRELYLITDAQAASWSAIDTSFETAWKQAARSSARMRFLVIPVGNGERENVAIESVQILNPPAIRQQPAEVEIRVRNFGAVPRTAWPLRILRNETDLLTTTVNLSPEGVATVTLPVTFDAAGPHVISASAAAAGPPADDALATVIDVSEPVKVLIISGDERQERFHSESDFLRAALMPFHATGQSGPDPAAVDVVAADKWSEADIDAYQVVVLANVSQITDVQARSLEQFVVSGGGLLIAPGSLSRLQNYADMLAAPAGPADLLPAALRLPAEDAPVTQLMSVDREHPVFRHLRGTSTALPTAAIARRVIASPRDGTGRVLASFRSGEPFLIESSRGRGRVLLVSTTLDADWNALPVSNFYLPFIQSAVRYLAGDPSASLNLLPGQTFEHAYEAADEDAPATVIRPDGTREFADPLRSGERAEFRYANTWVPGRYTAELSTARGSRAVPFVVRAPADESDLTPLSAPQWNRLQQALGFQRVGPDGSSIAAATTAARSSRELWPALLALVAGLALLELLLARLWSEEERP